MTVKANQTLNDPWVGCKQKLQKFKMLYKLDMRPILMRHVASWQDATYKL